MSSFLFRRSALAANTNRAAATRFLSTTSPRQFARINILGHLGDSPELHTTPNGREVIRYIVASNKRSGGENKQTSWWRVAAFAEGGSRDYLLNLPKGTHVLVEGDAQMNSYTDAEGNPRSSLNIVQRHLETIRRPASAREGESQAE